MMKLSRRPDYPIVIGRLNQHYTLAEISTITGVDKTQLSSIKTESRPPPEPWADCWNLIDLYMRTHGGTLPLYGNHNVIDESVNND